MMEERLFLILRKYHGLRRIIRISPYLVVWQGFSLVFSEKHAMIVMAKNCELCSFREVSDLKQTLKHLKHYGYWLAVFLIWELSIHWSAYTGFVRFIPGVFFTACYAALLTLLIELPGWAGKICSWILPPVAMLIYGVQLIYYEVFGGLLTVAFISGGGDAVTTFYTVIFGAIWRRLPQVLLLILPIVGFHVLRHFRLLAVERFSMLRTMALLAAAALLCGTAVMTLSAYGPGPNQPAALFRNPAATVDQWVEYFGVITSGILDLGRQGKAAAPVLAATPVEKTPELDYENRNVLKELDFDALDAMADEEALKTLNAYFRSLPGTEKHAYTGLFRGYNLIVICAEAFSNYVIDPELTPTLYRMSTEGIVFENYYNSFPNLTTNGEYSLCMGLMPDLSRMSFAVSMENYLPYALGNICAENGMKAMAYHNNVGTFYNRINTHTNMGYEFQAVDFGLDMEPGTPTSDLEMMQETMADYLPHEPFHAYYMTYSGHSDYDFETNSMSIKNRELVEELPYSEQVKAYLACQLELEHALTYMIDRLEQTGQADRTVIVLTGDHLPYGLTEEAYAELAGEDAVKEPFWQYRNSFLCWTGGLETPIVVEEYCCTMDILPTMLNLFGFTYDSRLLTGRDVLADTTHMALLKDGSFLTADVVYDASSGKLTWIAEEDPALAESLQQYAANQFAVSAAILDTDYYEFALGGLELTEGREERETYTSYADIGGTWYAGAVERLTTYGALSGGSTGAFNGGGVTSRADFMAMVTRAMGLQGSGSHNFADVAEDDWYRDVLDAAVDAGLVPKSESFRPMDPITAGEALIILRRAGAEDWVYDAVESVQRKQAEEDYRGAEGTFSRGAAAWLVAMLLDPEGLPELTFRPVEEKEPKPVPAPEQVWQPVYTPEPVPEPEPEPEESWVIPEDPLAPDLPEDPVIPEEEMP